MKKIFKNRKIGFWGGILVLIICACCFVCIILERRNACSFGWCSTKDEIEEVAYASADGSDENHAVYESGYDLPVEDSVMEEAENDCKQVMESIREIYINADKGNSKNVVISDEAAEQMLAVIAKTGYPVIAGQLNSNMCNYTVMESFLAKAANGEVGEQTTYEILTGGGIHRKQYCFDGTDMYVYGTIATWNGKNKPAINTTTCYRLKEWEYTEKGWFIFEYCVPEPPAVSERINGTGMIRVKPLDAEYREIAEVYLSPIGYQGNNLFCSDWDVEHLEDLDYNGLFQYLYTIEYREYMDSDKYVTGIPKEEFESMMEKYLPVTREQLVQYAAYDSESQIYRWQILGCGNYSPSLFGTSAPEITDMIKNEDGTTTLTIDAVCEMLGNDAVITHILTVRFEENGAIVFLGNQVLDDGLQKIPTYEYRFDGD